LALKRYERMCDQYEIESCGPQSDQQAEFGIGVSLAGRKTDEKEIPNEFFIIKNDAGGILRLGSSLIIVFSVNDAAEKFAKKHASDGRPFMISRTDFETMAKAKGCNAGFNPKKVTATVQFYA